MNIKPIRNDDDLKAAFVRLEAIFQAPEGSPEGDEMEVLVALVEAYENKHYPVGPADPVEAIKFRMEQQGLAAGQSHERISAQVRRAVDDHFYEMNTRPAAAGLLFP